MVTVHRKVVKRLPESVTRNLPGKIVIRKISSAESRALNRCYRKKNKPADVLSFRYGKDYGEILVCPEVIRREAKEQGNTYTYQMTWMIVHGMLHLAGMHHEKSQVKARRVAAMEQKILKKLFSKV